MPSCQSVSLVCVSKQHLDATHVMQHPDETTLLFLAARSVAQIKNCSVNCFARHRLMDPSAEEHFSAEVAQAFQRPERYEL